MIHMNGLINTKVFNTDSQQMVTVELATGHWSVSTPFSQTLLLGLITAGICPFQGRLYKTFLLDNG